MRVFVSGGSGFVGTWLIAHLQAEGDVVDAPFADVTDEAAVCEAIAQTGPEIVYHLAGQADVAESWRSPSATFAANALGTLHVVEAARALNPAPRVVVVSSGEVYGHVLPEDLPLQETHPARPVSPYGASKLAAEEVGLQTWRGSGVPVIVTRAFNHIGPGQSDRFVVSAIARQIAEAERDGHDVVQVGNLSPRRDVTDVRDVVRAYRAVGLRGRPGEVYNVCSGLGISIQELVDGMIRLSKRPLRVEIDPGRVRPVDLPTLLGDPSKIAADTGWTPVYEREATLRDVLSWWRREVITGGSGAQPAEA